MNDYYLTADMFNKFHTSSEFVQVLWLISFVFIWFGICWCVKEVVLAFAPKQEPHKPQGKLIYTIYQTDSNELLIYNHAGMTEAVQKDSALLLPVDISHHSA